MIIAQSKQIVWRCVYKSSKKKRAESNQIKTDMLAIGNFDDVGYFHLGGPNLCFQRVHEDTQIANTLEFNYKLKIINKHTNN